MVHYSPSRHHQHHRHSHHDQNHRRRKHGHSKHGGHCHDGGDEHSSPDTCAVVTHHHTPTTATSCHNRPHKSKHYTDACPAKELEVVCVESACKANQDIQWIHRYLWLIGIIVVIMLILLCVMARWRWKRYGKHHGSV